MTVNSHWIVSSSNRSLKTGLIELYEALPILRALVRRELKSRYRGSILGFAWVLGKPIMTLVVFSLIIGEVLGASKSIDYFALYLFVGLMFWGFFSESISSATSSIVNAEGLIQKIAFPREILPVTSVLIAAVNTLVQVPVLLIGYALFQKWPSSSDLVFLIPLMFILFFFVSGLALILSATTVYIRDLKPLTDLVLMLLMYASPLIYSWTFVQELIVNKFGEDSLFQIYLANPLSIVIISLQDVLWPGQRRFSDGSSAQDLFTISSFAIWAVLLSVILFFLFAYKVFLKLEPNFAREL